MFSIQHQYRNSLAKSKLSNYRSLNAAFRLEIVKLSIFAAFFVLKFNLIVEKIKLYSEI